MKKNVLVVTGSRGEYGYIRPFLQKIKNHPVISADVVVTNMHLMETHGYSADFFEKDGISIKYRILNTLDSDSAFGLLKSLHIFGLGLIDILYNNDYDVILLAGDRGEQLFSSIIGFHLNIPVFHIQAGERSGHIDGMSRHAIARFAHIHLAANNDAADRLVRFGEQEFRVHNTGAPQLDEIHQLAKGKISEKLPENLERFLDNRPFVLLVFHPVQEDLHENKLEIQNIIQCLKELSHKVVVIAPNSDPGTAYIQKLYESLPRDQFALFKNIERFIYLTLLKRCSAIIGNSSSGLIEAPVFSTPCLNIGRRQHGRVSGKNTIHSSGDVHSLMCSLRKVLDPRFKTDLVNSPDSP